MLPPRGVGAVDDEAKKWICRRCLGIEFDEADIRRAKKWVWKRLADHIRVKYGISPAREEDVGMVQDSA